jgi:hypothetical protein
MKTEDRYLKFVRWSEEDAPAIKENVIPLAASKPAHG